MKGAGPAGGRLQFLRKLEAYFEQLFLAAAEQRECAMRWDIPDRLAVSEIVAELSGGIVLAFDERRKQHTVIIQMRAQVREQLRVLGKLLGQDRSCALERRLDVRHTRIVALLRGECSLEILRRLHFRRQRMISKQPGRERIETRFACDLRFGASLLLVGQVQIFETLFRLRRFDARAQFRRQLLLLIDAGENRRAALVQLAQVRQPLLERA